MPPNHDCAVAYFTPGRERTRCRYASGIGLMIATLWIVMSRSTPAISGLPVSATRSVCIRSNCRKATTIEASVSPVRSFLRPRFAHSSGRCLNMAGSVVSSRNRFRRELSLVEMQHVLGASRGVRIVRDHDDGLALLRVQRLQQIQDLIARLAVEVAGGLVAQQERGIGNDRARDADALFLAARQLTRLVLGALAQADEAECGTDPLVAIPRRQ